MDIISVSKGIVDSMVETISSQGIDPYIIVYESYPGVSVPPGFSKDGYITLNLALHAVRAYDTDDDCIMYGSQFNGIHSNVVIPYGSIAGVYPRSEPNMMIQIPVVIPSEPEVVEESSIELPKPNPKANANWAESAVVHSR